MSRVIDMESIVLSLILMVVCTIHNVEGVNVTDTYDMYCPGHRVCRSGGFFNDFENPWPCYNADVWCQKCQCDPECYKFGDCCPQILPLRKNETSRPKESFACVSEYFNRGQGYTAVGYHYYMVSSCPDSYPDRTIAVQCANPAVISFGFERPVYSDVTGTTYTNEFCAICNGEETFVFWNIYVACLADVAFQSAASIKNFFDEARSNNCSIIAELPLGAIVRRCPSELQNAIVSCNVTGKWRVYDRSLNDACESIAIPFTYYGTVYKNVYCSLCNGEAEPGDPFCITFPGSILVPSFAALIDFNRKDESPKSVKNKTTVCNDSYIYDECQDACLQIMCTSGKTLINSSCVSIVTRVFGISYDHTFQLSVVDPQNNTFNLSWLSGSDDFKSILDVYTERTSFEVYPNFELTINFRQLENDPDLFRLYSIDVNVSMTLRLWTNKDALEASIINAVANDWMLTLESRVILLRSSNTVPSDQLNEHMNSTGVDITPLLYLSSWYLPEKMPTPKETTRVSRFLVCPYLPFDQSYVNMTSDNTVTISDLIFQANEYEATNNTVRICADVFRRRINESSMSCPRPTPPPTNKPNAALGILSLVCAILSIICLVLTLLTYFLFSNLRTLPGKTNMCLSATLLGAQILFQFVSTEVPHGPACTAVGALIHFMWLSTFGWMSVCSFRVFRVFSSQKRTRQLGSAKHCRQLSKYALYAHGLPVIIVGATFAANAASSNGAILGYGAISDGAAEILCYLLHARDLLWAFAVPLALMIVTNFIFFMITANNIRKTPDVPGSNKESRNNLCVYLKLSTLTGMTWIFGILAELIWNELHYAFIIFNASQGVFLFSSFILNKRVWHLYKNLCMTYYTEKPIATASTNL